MSPGCDSKVKSRHTNLKLHYKPPTGPCRACHQVRRGPGAGLRVVLLQKKQKEIVASTTPSCNPLHHCQHKHRCHCRCVPT
uniref:Uncharacterized protein n=1 Tax=Arundo donax TaxID=35708 RepID=A0A0A9ELZ7_ARUDO